MPKTVQFDIDDVLTRAMHVFWRYGYRATTMRALADATGIQAGSIYNTFGGKRGLFLQALGHYDRVHREIPLAELAVWPSPRQAVMAAFEGAVAAVLEDGSQDGCMAVNLALELSPHDEEVSVVVARAFAGMEAFLRDAIERGQACGEISRAVDPGATARALLALFLGLRVLARSRPEEQLLRDVARQAEVLLAQETLDPVLGDIAATDGPASGSSLPPRLSIGLAPASLRAAAAHRCPPPGHPHRSGLNEATRTPIRIAAPYVLAIAPGISKPGDYVDLHADMDVLAVLSNCPEALNEAAGRNPTPIRAIVYSR